MAIEGRSGAAAALGGFICPDAVEAGAADAVLLGEVGVALAASVSSVVASEAEAVAGVAASVLARTYQQLRLLAWSVR
ncbi:hypothetical protein [Rhodopseudomonas palustris]|uniref:Uncharacterized protein n=1 Tax=Rhodopseudomonas palustris TaxID=1076 RepID=A0A418VR82_RHOPL|nr:hypothetical protein [Rhodopseudomonas palustris]RJF78866.1 hypothetical protein D4Q52_01565 [Rhodopseudomonas palustris]